MPNLSRRHLVTTAAALPALAMPAIADPNGPNPDAELLSSGTGNGPLIAISMWSEKQCVRRQDCRTSTSGVCPTMNTGPISRSGSSALPGSRVRDRWRCAGATR
jgi:hypothetical protein